MYETTRIPGVAEGQGTPRPPFGGKRRLTEVVSVRLPGGRQRVECDLAGVRARPGDLLVVKFKDGDLVTESVGHAERRVVTFSGAARAVRRASEQDARRWDDAQEEAERALRVAVRSARRLKVNAKMVTAFVPLSGNKVVVYYSAESRVDVGALARDIASTLSSRVELRSVGVREGAGAVGGLGPCGGELCCSAFLTQFSSISVRHAKNQGISLNPGRITGMCGRLKCCLVYEEATHKEMKGYAPRKRNGVFTPSGPGEILDVDPVARRVLVRIAGGGMENFHIRDVTVFDRPLTQQEIRVGAPSKEEAVLAARRRRRGDSGPRASGASKSVLGEDYIWDDTEANVQVSAERADPSGDGAAKKRRRRRKKPRSDSSAPASQPSAEKSSASGEGRPKKQEATRPGGPDTAGGEAPKRRRRPRRRGGRSKGSSDQGGGGSSGGGDQSSS